MAERFLHDSLEAYGRGDYPRPLLRGFWNLTGYEGIPWKLQLPPAEQKDQRLAQEVLVKQLAVNPLRERAGVGASGRERPSVERWVRRVWLALKN